MKTEIVTTSNHHRMTAFYGDFITQRIKKRGLYERQTLDFVRNYLSGITGPVIADVGANIGNHSLDFSTYASRVYSFEPVGMTFGLLKRNVEDNNIENVILVNKALSDEAGESEIFIIAGNVGASSFDDREEGCEKVKVAKIVGDDYFIEQGIDRLDFIKIDVEGHEESALRGFMKTIKKFKPVIMMEWSDVEAIEKINASRFMDELTPDYKIVVLGGNRDEGYWRGRLLGGFRRRLAKIFLSHQAVLYPFVEQEKYRNILLIPK